VRFLPKLLVAVLASALQASGGGERRGDFSAGPTYLFIPRIFLSYLLLFCLTRDRLFSFFFTFLCAMMGGLLQGPARQHTAGEAERSKDG